MVLAKIALWDWNADGADSYGSRRSSHNHHQNQRSNQFCINRTDVLFDFSCRVEEMISHRAKKERS